MWSIFVTRIFIEWPMRTHSQKAAGEGRVVLTFDLDFGEILATTGERGVSVVVFRVRDTRTERVIERLHDVLEQSSDAVRDGAVIVVEDAQHRVRRLPFERRSS